MTVRSEQEIADAVTAKLLGQLYVGARVRIRVSGVVGVIREYAPYAFPWRVECGTAMRLILSFSAYELELL